MESRRIYPDRIEDFIENQVISRGLDERTAIAYRMDLEKFYLWPGAVSSSVRTSEYGRDTAGLGESDGNLSGVSF